MCYVKCQNILVNILVHLLENLSFRFRCPSFLLSKFASQKLIQSAVRVGILGICFTSSILRELLSGFWVSRSQALRPRDLVPVSLVTGSDVPGSQFQSPGCHDPRVPGSRVSGSQCPGSQVLILDYAHLHRLAVAGHGNEFWSKWQFMIFEVPIIFLNFITSLVIAPPPPPRISPEHHLTHCVRKLVFESP